MEISMANVISDETIEYVGILAKLELSDEEKEILTDACKIFVIKGKDVALAKGEYSNLKITTVTDLKIAKSMIEKD